MTTEKQKDNQKEQSKHLFVFTLEDFNDMVKCMSTAQMWNMIRFEAGYGIITERKPSTCTLQLQDIDGFLGEEWTCRSKRHCLEYACKWCFNNGYLSDYIKNLNS